MALSGKVCIVTGASRGVGKGIALQLGENGAIVYITGRTLRPKDTPAIPGSLQETASQIEERGGRCIAIQCDHSKDEDVKKLFERVNREQNGQLDILVNNAFSAFDTVVNNLQVPFWELPENAYDDVNIVGLRNHYLCSVLAAKMMVPRKSGLIINISDVSGIMYTASGVPYSIGKIGCDRMAADCGLELKKHNICFISLWPGMVQTEGALMIRNDPKLWNKLVTAGGMDPELFKAMYEHGESPEYAGKCIVHLATDKDLMKKSGKVLIAADIGDMYGFRDVDGQRPFNMRRINSLLGLAPRWVSWMAWFIPDFVKIPTWVVSLAGNKLY